MIKMIQQITALMAVICFIPTMSFAEFKEQQLAIIPDGHLLAFVTGNISFSQDGRNVAVAVAKGKIVLVVTNNRRGKEYSHVRDLVISPDGRHVAHNGTLEPKSAAPGEFLVINGVETGPFYQVCNPVFSHDSRIVAFDYTDARNKWHHAVVLVGENRIEAETAAVDQNWTRPVFSRDDKLVVSIQQHFARQKSTRLVSTANMKEVRRKEYDAIDEVVYSNDLLRTAYRARHKGKQFIVTSSFEGGDEQEGGQYDYVSAPVLSPDGLHLAYSAEKGGNRFLIVDGKKHAAQSFYDAIKPVFSHDWKKFVYLGQRNGRSFVVVNGSEGPGYDDISSIAINPNGSMSAYAALAAGKWRLVIANQEGSLYDTVDTVQFTPDGRNLLFRASKGGKRYMVIADLVGKTVQEGVACDEIWQPSFDDKGQIGYGALVGNEIWWKVMPRK